METQYYVYALDTEKGLITAALSCPDERTAKRAYLSARRKMETGNCFASHFHFNYSIVNAVCSIKYQKFNGWNVEEGFERSDFEDAESVTKDNIPKFEKKYRYHDSKNWECYPADILFMRHVQSALSAIFLGFDPQDIPAEEQMPSWETVPATNVDTDTDAPPVLTIAASGQGSPKSGMTAAEEAYQASIEWTDDPAEVNVNNPKEISDPIVAAIEKQTAVLEKAYFGKESGTLTQEHYPADKEGFWEPQKEYADRMNLKESTLQRYRETSNGARRSKDGTWGIDKAGNIFKREGDKPNSPYLYFVNHDS
jgi:hypothetical protein